MSNLQPLKWHDASGVDGVYSERTDSYIKDALWFCSTLVAEYVIRKKGDKYVVTYGGRTEPEYDTLDDAKRWAEHTHYASKMQPYVKPSPTYTLLSKFKPSEDGRYLTLKKGFTYEMGNLDDLVPHVGFWNGGRGCFDDDYDDLWFTHWMELPKMPNGDSIND